ncbi:MAG: hypothetical protein IJ933_09615, partial [Bacteroidales bacterium]|nr:hypothetical protein [Bacteroidales bacterium]
MEEINIVKIGGKVIDNEDERNKFLAKLSGIKKNIILVHGGGKVANQILTSMGIEPVMMGGRRITDAETLKGLCRTHQQDHRRPPQFARQTRRGTFRRGRHTLRR